MLCCCWSHPLSPWGLQVSSHLKVVIGVRGGEGGGGGADGVFLSASPSSGRPVQTPAGAAGRWVMTRSCPPLSNPEAQRQHMINNNKGTQITPPPTSQHTHTDANCCALAHSPCPESRNWAGIRTTRSPPGPSPGTERQSTRNTHVE